MPSVPVLSHSLPLSTVFSVHVLAICENRSTLSEHCGIVRFIGRAEGSRTRGLRIANRTTGKNLGYCLFKSCSHQEISRVFLFLPIPYHRIYVACSYFCPRIGHLGFRYPDELSDSKLLAWLIDLCLAELRHHQFQGLRSLNSRLVEPPPQSDDHLTSRKEATNVRVSFF